MSLNNEERAIIVSLELEKAQSIFGQIKELRNLGYWDNIANRLYYSVFHAVSALLINDGHEVSSHKGAVVIFGRYYVKTGIMSLTDGKLYSQLQTMREKSDYNCAYNTTREEIEPMIGPTEDLIRKIAEKITT